MKKFILALIFLSFSLNCLAAQEAEGQRLESLREKLVGSMVKTFAKTYVATNNLQKFKEKNIKKILKMDEAKFQRVYGKIYNEMIKDLPQSIKDEYGIKEHMTREMAIAQINAFTSKQQVYKMINAIPNRMIALHYAKHRNEFNKSIKNKNVDGIVDNMLVDPAASHT